jgi:YD repeat-containing protein
VIARGDMIHRAGASMKISRRNTLAQLLLGGVAWLVGRDALADTVTYTYDALGRVVTATYQDGAVITYTYDPAGNRTQVTQALGPFAATIAITGTGPVNLRTLANTAGYDGARNATVLFTLANGVTVTGAAGAPNGGVGIDTGTWPTGSYTIDLDLQISGNVYGGGGRGGKGAGLTSNATSAGGGGDAINCQTPIDIVVNSGGQVKGGGGGGGGGGGWNNADLETDRAGGGGGGGFPNGPGGLKGDNDGGGAAQNGAAGTTAGGGAGGAGSPNSQNHAGGVGGAGGDAATNGSNGAQSTGSAGSGWVKTNASNGLGGGYAIRKNGNTVPVTNNGTITGTVG